MKPLDRRIGARLARARTVDYNKRMKSFGRTGDAGEVLRLLAEMKDSNLEPNVFCYNTAIDALISSGRYSEAEALFKQMVSARVTPSVASYNIMVKLHSCYLFRFDLAYEIVQRMSEYGCSPDSVTYSTLIAGLCRAGRISEAWGVLDWMLEEQCLPSVWSYTPIVHGYCLEAKIEEAKRLMNAMERVGCPPNVVTYNVLIEALCKSGRFDEVEKILDNSIVKGWKPNVVTYNTFMNGLCKWGKTKEARGKIEVMINNGLDPTAVTLNILLHCLCRESGVFKAKCLLESSELEWVVDVVAYNIVMSQLCSFGRWFDVLKLLVDMLKKGIDPNARTFNIVIHSLCKGGNLRLAKCIVDSRGFVANVVTYNTLIHWFNLKGKHHEIQALLSDMEIKKISLNIFTYATIIRGLFREEMFFNGSVENNGFLDLIISLMYNLVKSGTKEELLYLLEEIAQKDFALSGLIFESLIRAFCSDIVKAQRCLEYVLL